MLRINAIIILAWTISLPVLAQLSSPEIKVEAVNQVEVTSANTWQMKFTNQADGNATPWFLGASEPSWSISNDGIPYFAISTGSKRYPGLAINTNGEVTMGGSTAFDGVLKIAKGGRTSGHTLMIGSANASGPIWSFFHYGSTERTYIRAGKSNSDVYIADVGTQRVVIGNSSTTYDRGALVVRGGAVMQKGTWDGSDRKIKKNIKKLNQGLSVIKKISTVRYDYATDLEENDSQQVGVIAQELKKVAPNLVKEFVIDKPSGKKDKYGNEVLEKDAEKFLAVRSDGLTYLLINAVQEQQTLIEELQQEVKLLKTVKNK